MSLNRRYIPWLIGLIILIICGIFTWYIFAGTTQDATWVAIGLAALASLFAAISAGASLVQAHEAQKQREMSERPNLMVYFDSAYSGVVYLVITNSGNAPAIDVKIKFDPGFQIYSGESINNISLFQNPISFFPPGMTYRQVLDASYRFMEKGKPTYFEAHIEYTTVLGERITETTKYDLEYLRDTHLPERTTEKSLAEISDHFKKLNGLLHQMKKGNSLLVQLPDDFYRRLGESRESNDSSES